MLCHARAISVSPLPAVPRRCTGRRCRPHVRCRSRHRSHGASEGRDRAGPDATCRCASWCTRWPAGAAPASSRSRASRLPGPAGRRLSSPRLARSKARPPPGGVAGSAPVAVAGTFRVGTKDAAGPCRSSQSVADGQPAGQERGTGRRAHWRRRVPLGEPACARPARPPAAHGSGAVTVVSPTSWRRPSRPSGPPRSPLPSKPRPTVCPH